jgi:hypothetical protein
MSSLTAAIRRFIFARRRPFEANLRTEILASVLSCDEERLRDVLRGRRADCDSAPYPGGSIIGIAAAAGFPSIVSILLDAGARADGADDVPPLALAAEGNQDAREGSDFDETIRLLLAAGADPNAEDGAGRSALFLAASTDKHKAVRHLLDAGADPTFESCGASVLDVATGRSAGIVRAFLEREALKSEIAEKAPAEPERAEPPARRRRL